MTVVELQGYDKIAAVIAGKVRAAGTIEFDVIPGGNRGPHRNALIARIQEARDRNPWYLGKEALEGIRFASRGLISLDATTVASSIRTISDLLLTAVRANVGAMKNPDGSSFRELSAKYAAFKRRKFGFIHPILKATNDLIGGLKVLVKKT